MKEIILSILIIFGIIQQNHNVIDRETVSVAERQSTQEWLQYITAFNVDTIIFPTISDICFDMDAMDTLFSHWSRISIVKDFGGIHIEVDGEDTGWAYSLD